VDNTGQALKEFQKEIELEIAQIKTVLVNVVSKALERFSPTPLHSAGYSQGDFAINTFIDVGTQELRMVGFNYEAMHPHENLLTNVAANYAMVRSEAAQKILQKPFDNIWIYNTTAYNLLIEKLGWNSAPTAIDEDVVIYSLGVDPTEVFVWEHAKHQAYKPFTRAFQLAKAALPSLIKQYNRIIR